MAQPARRRPAASPGSRPSRGVRTRLALPALCTLATLGLAGETRAQDVELIANPTRWRIGVEQVNPTGPGEAVMVGVHYDLLEIAPRLPGLYLGFGGFGAILGDRGSLYAAGTTLGFVHALNERWALDVGAFVGGGGADEGDWDGGLFLRPHVALERRLGERLRWRIEVSHTNSPGGDLSSTQIGLGLTHTDELLTADYSPFDLRPIPRGSFEEEREGLVLGMLYMDPSSGSRTKDGGRLGRRLLLGTAGVELPLEDGWVIPLELAGSAAGGVSGYAQALAGLGRRGPWFPGETGVLDWHWRILAGPAGGGGVDTGGGLLLAGQAGFEGYLGRDWALRMLGGYFVAPDGHFDGTMLDVALRWAPRAVALPPDFDRDRLAREGIFGRDYELDAWRVALLHKSYFLPRSVLDKDGEPLRDDVHLIGAGAEKDFGRWWTLSLRGFSAWDGEIGGYHEGQIGLRYNLDVLRTVRAGDFYAQYHAGAGGGGNADVGPGLLHEFSAGWRYSPWPGFAFGLELGKARSDRGTFEGESLLFSFAWELMRPLMR